MARPALPQVGFYPLETLLWAYFLHFPSVLQTQLTVLVWDIKSISLLSSQHKLWKKICAVSENTESLAWHFCSEHEVYRGTLILYLFFIFHLLTFLEEPLPCLLAQTSCIFSVAFMVHGTNGITFGKVCKHGNYI